MFCIAYNGYSWYILSFELRNAHHKRRQRRWQVEWRQRREYTKYSIYSNAARGIRDTPIGAPPGFQNGRRPARPEREVAAVSGGT